jgi:hypothetical protein
MHVRIIYACLRAHAISLSSVIVSNLARSATLGATLLPPTDLGNDHGQIEKASTHLLLKD